MHRFIIKNPLINFNTTKRSLMVDHSANALKIEYLKKTFAKFNKPNHYEHLLTKLPIISKLKRCSILVPITLKQVKNEKGMYVQKSFFTLTKRPDTIKTFKGQVCFVGGKRDLNDTNDISTALREANEEISLGAERVTILGELCPIMTTNADLVTPVIAFFDDTDFKPVVNHDEVDLVFELPTERFLMQGHGYSNKCFKSGNTQYFVHYFEDALEGKVLNTWGFTALAAILVSSMLHSRMPEFPLDPEMPLTNENSVEYLDLYLQKSTKNLKKSTMFH